MRITITQDFDTPEAAAVFLARVGNPAYVSDTLMSAPVPTLQNSSSTDGLGKTRKPRADAGQKREPYRPRTTTTGEPAASEPGNGGGASAPASQPAAPATPTITAAPAAPAAQAQEAKRTDLAPSAAATQNTQDFPATLEGARKAMAALNATAGRGMDACIQALKSAGVNRISDLPREKYADFIKDVLVQSSKEGIEFAKKAPATKK